MNLRQYIRPVALLLVAVSAGAATAEEIRVTTSGAPASVSPGQTYPFNIALEVSGNSLGQQVSVSSHYILNANGTVTTGSQQAVFQLFDGNYSGKDAIPQPTAQAGTLEIAPGVAPGPYTVQLVGSKSDNRGTLTFGDTSQFTVQVLPGGAKPLVTINTPANNGSYKIGQTLTLSVAVDANGSSLTGHTALLNGVGLTLVHNENEDAWELPVLLTQPGVNTFEVTFTNGFGSTTVAHTFSAVWNFGGFLPPVTTSKVNRGRTLPIKFSIGDFNGPTADAYAEVYVNGTFVGIAVVHYENGLPVYQVNYNVPSTSGVPLAITVLLNDGATHALPSTLITK